MITQLKSNQIFVFGSNTDGFHYGGAAAQAYEQFGAVWGVGEGPTWRIVKNNKLQENKEK
jgi:hypothetical protein